MINDTIYYIDITKNGRDLTGTKDISIVSNEQAVMESVYNILMTEPGERVMNPEFGCHLNKYLFEIIDFTTAISIQTEIEYAINKFEDRIKNLSIDVNPLYDENTFLINIYFQILLSAEIKQMSIKISKLR